MNWIIKNDQIINLDLVSEIYKYFDGKFYIKFKLSDSNTSLFFENAKTRDAAFNKIQEKLSPHDVDI